MKIENLQQFYALDKELSQVRTAINKLYKCKAIIEHGDFEISLSIMDNQDYTGLSNNFSINGESKLIIGILSVQMEQLQKTEAEIIQQIEAL